MKVIHENKTYMSGGGRASLDESFDYCLFRQDFGGSESVLFNTNELDEVIEKVECGDIMIHMNYSILYCKTDELLTKAEEIFGCYCTTF